MSIRFFSGEESRRRGSRVAPARESQQALLLRRLREANGATVSYADLRDVGIELPASVVSELELAGIPIERRYELGEGSRRRPGVRLDPELDPERATEETIQSAPTRTVSEPARARRQRVNPSAGRLTLSSFRSLTPPSFKDLNLPSVKGFTLPSVKRFTLPSIPSVGRLSVPFGGRLTDHRPATRALAPIALIGAVIVVIVVVVVALQTGSARPRHAAAHHASKLHPRSTSVVARAPQTSPTPPTPSTPIDPALATQFEAQGHDLLQSGQYSTAISVLRRALAATGQQLSDCLEPVSETCLTYAYALYDLGRALELNGEPSAAVPVLEQRLQIDNQRDVVAAALAQLRTVGSQ